MGTDAKRKMLAAKNVAGQGLNADAFWQGKPSS
jgi:hypothetical protein